MNRKTQSQFRGRAKGIMRFALLAVCLVAMLPRAGAQDRYTPGVIPAADSLHATHPVGVCGGKNFEPRLEFCDARDNRIYRWVKIGKQSWMADNLNFGTMISGDSDQLNPGEKYCLYDMESDCAALYQWHQAVGSTPEADAKRMDLKGNVQGICPAGWHLPRAFEWRTLLDLVDKEQGKENEAESLMSYSEDDNFKWKTNTNPDEMLPSDKYGFRVVSTGARIRKGECPVGKNNHTNFCNAHDCAMFWTADDDAADRDPATAVNFTFTEDIPEVSEVRIGIDPKIAEKIKMQNDGRKVWKQAQKIYGMSVRCVKD